MFVPHRLAALNYMVKRLLPRTAGEPALRLLPADRVAALAPPSAPPANSDLLAILALRNAGHAAGPLRHWVARAMVSRKAVTAASRR